MTSRVWFIESSGWACGKQGLRLHSRTDCAPRTSSRPSWSMFCPFLWEVSVECLLPRAFVHVTCETSSPPLCPAGPLFCLTFGEACLTFILAQPQDCGVMFGWFLRLAGLPCKQQCSRWKHRKQILRVVKQPWLSEWPQLVGGWKWPETC